MKNGGADEEKGCNTSDSTAKRDIAAINSEKPVSESEG